MRLHRADSIRQEAQDAIAALLQHLFLTESNIICGTVISSQVLNPYEVNMNRLDNTYVQPVTTPGPHFHDVPYLATVQGIIVGTDAGTPNPKERARAMELEHPAEECDGMSAAGVQLGPDGEIVKSVVRAPATAQAMALIVYVQAASEKAGKVVWVIPDSQLSRAALEAYYRDPKTHGMMSQIVSQVMEG